MFVSYCKQIKKLKENSSLLQLCLANIGGTVTSCPWPKKWFQSETVSPWLWGRFARRWSCFLSSNGSGPHLLTNQEILSVLLWRKKIMPESSLQTSPRGIPRPDENSSEILVRLWVSFGLVVPGKRPDVVPQLPPFDVKGQRLYPELHPNARGPHPLPQAEPSHYTRETLQPKLTTVAAG